MLLSPTNGGSGAGSAENAGGSAAERARSEELEAEQYLDDVLHDASMGGGANAGNVGNAGGSGHVGIGTGVSAFHAVR
jgi:hypothetical protein